MAEMNGSATETSMANSETTKKSSLKDMPKEELLILLKKAKMRGDDFKKKNMMLEKKLEEDQAGLKNLLSVNEVESIAELSLKMENLISSVRRVSSERDALSAEKNAMISRLEEKDFEVTSLEEKIKVVCEEKEASARMYQQANEQVQCMQMKVETFTETCKFLQDEVSKLNSANSELKNEVNVLSDARDTALEALKKMKEEYASSDNKAKLKDLQEKCSSLEAELGAYIQAKEHVKLLEEKNDILEKQNLELMEKCELLVSEKASIQKQLEASLTEIADLKIKVNELPEIENKYFDLKKNSDELNKECSLLRDKCEQLESEKFELENSWKKTIETNDSLKQRLSHLESIVEGDAEKLRESESLRKKFEEELLSAQEEIDKLRATKSLLEKQAHDCNKMEDQLKDARIQMQNYTEANQRLTEELQILFGKNSELENEVQRLSVNLKQCNSERQMLLSEVESAVQGMLTRNDGEQERDPQHIIQLLKYSSVEFNEMKIQLDSLRSEKMEAEMQVQTEDSSNQPRVLPKEDSSTQTETLEPEISDDEVSSLFERVDVLQRENENFKAEIARINEAYEEEKSKCSEIGLKYSTSLSEIETLKQQLDEYENDIQTHQNLEQENVKLLECVKELEKDNYDLNVCLDNKLAELSDINTHIESMLTSVAAFVKYKDDVISSENDIEDNLYALKSLFDVIASQKDKDAELLRKMEMDVIELSRSKQNMSSELEQLKSLNQFLEDEIKELREEAEQSSSKTAGHVRDAKDENASGHVASESTKTELADGWSQTESSGLTDSSVQVELENRARDRTYSHSSSFPGELSEWGYVAEDDLGVASSQNDMEYELQRLNKENKDLKSLVETKSSLVEEIHCQVDSLLSKVEEISEELESKNAEVESLSREKAYLLDSLNEMSSLLGGMKTTLPKVSSSVISVRQGQASVVEFVQQFRTVYQGFVANIENAVNRIQVESQCYYSSMVSLKNDRDRMVSEISDTLELSHQLSKEVSSISELVLSAGHEQTSQITPESGSSCQKSITDSPRSVLQEVLLDLGRLRAAFVDNVSFRKESLVNKEETNGPRDSEKHRDNLQKESVLRSCPSESGDCGLEKPDCDSCEKLRKDLSDLSTKMNKLKAVAVKMKKELTFSNQMKESLEKKLKESNEELINDRIVHKQDLQNFQNLQNEYDKLQDEFEALKDERKNQQNDLTEKQSELKKCKEKLSDLEASCKKIQKQLECAESEKADKEKKFMEMESKVIVVQAKNTELQDKVQQLVTDLSKAKKELSEALEEREQFKKELENALKEGNKHSLLDLEMADYERTISELTTQLEKKTEEIKELKKDVEDQITKIFSLQEELKFSESSRRTEEMRAESFKKALENTKKELAIVREQESELKEEVAKLNARVETLGLQEEDYKSQISTQSVELEHLKEMLKSSGENHQRIVQNLNSKIAAQKQEVLIANKEVESIKQSFENYKTRVHNVLKQQKTVTNPLSASDAEIKEKLEAQNEKLKLQVKDLSEKLHALTLESDTLREEHDHLLQRQNTIVEELEAKDRQWNLRLEQVNIEKSRLQAQLDDRASQYSLQVEVLASTYKKQIKLIQEEHKHALEELQKQLESADVEISRLQREQQINVNAAMLASTHEDSLTFDILSQERQEGEGSEFAEGSSTPVKHLSLATIPTGGFLPLEKLLQSPAESETVSLISNHDSEKLSSDLNVASKKIEHLSELLNESEANNLHLTEQVRVLKEELRRLERNKQREAHAENLEYLKNVFIKFATLQPGSEKVTLLPVLNTILKLSPEEHQQLKSVAGAADSGDPAVAGWGSYLHRWSGVM